MLTDKIQYLIALIAEFARYYGLTDAQAAQYMDQYGALSLCDKHYGVMHTLPWKDNIESIACFLQRKGSNIFVTTMKMHITQEQFKMMIEDITSELVQALVERNAYNLPEAIKTVYASKTYNALTRPTTGLYNQSTGYILSYLYKELGFYPTLDTTSDLRVAEIL